MTDQVQNSYIVIKFSEPGSVVFETHFEGVTPYQIMAIAQYLEVVGKNELLKLLSQREEEKEAMGISKPTPKIMIAGQ